MARSDDTPWCHHREIQFHDGCDGRISGEAKSGYDYTTDHRQGEVVSNYSNTRHQNEHKGVCFRNFF